MPLSEVLDEANVGFVRLIQGAFRNSGAGPSDEGPVSVFALLAFVQPKDYGRLCCSTLFKRTLWCSQPIPNFLHNLGEGGSMMVHVALLLLL